MTTAELAELNRLCAVVAASSDTPFAATEHSIAAYGLKKLLYLHAKELIAAAEECERLRGALRLATQRLETIHETHSAIALDEDIVFCRAALEGTR